MSRPGDACKCQACQGRLYVYHTRLNLTCKMRIRYLRCNACGLIPESNKWIVPMEYAPPRPSNGIARNGTRHID